MNEQEYYHIRNLACDLLIDAKISRLPVFVDDFAATFNLSSVIDLTKTTYENMIVVAQRILELYGYDNNIDNVANLAIRILAPFIVLRELGIETPEEMSCIADVPLGISSYWLKQYNLLFNKMSFRFSPIEEKTLIQFMPWIEKSKFRYGIH